MTFINQLLVITIINNVAVDTYLNTCRNTFISKFKYKFGKQSFMAAVLKIL